MNMDKKISFNKDLSLYWHCESRDQFSISDLKSSLADPRHPVNEEEFRQMLSEAIRSPRYTLEQYEQMTGLDFESVDEVAADLRGLWQLMYGEDEALPE